MTLTERPPRQFWSLLPAISLAFFKFAYHSYAQAIVAVTVPKWNLHLLITSGPTAYAHPVFSLSALGVFALLLSTLVFVFPLPHRPPLMLSLSAFAFCLNVSVPFFLHHGVAGHHSNFSRSYIVSPHDTTSSFSFLIFLTVQTFLSRIHLYSTTPHIASG